MVERCASALSLASCVLLAACASGGPAPAAPTPTGGRYTLLDDGKPAGTSAQIGAAGGALVERLERADGSRFETTWTLDERGLPRRYVAAGRAGERARFDERFWLEGGSAEWQNSFDEGKAKAAGPAFYVPASPAPALLGLLARALLAAPGHKLRLLPQGEATIERTGGLRLEGVGPPRDVSQYAIYGLGTAPTRVWLDERGQFFASLGGDAPAVAEGFEGSVAELTRAEKLASAAWAARLAGLGRRPERGLLVRHARLFDPVSLSVRDGTSVLVRGGRVVDVGADTDVAAPPGVEVLDAAGRFVMPGLWDNHAHLFSEGVGARHLAAGVTTVRDLGNGDELPAQVRRYDSGEEAGPRVLMAVRIEGRATKPLGASELFVDTEAEAEQLVATYAGRGYAQVKVLDSMSPAVVPALARAAHGRGLRLSGHVPSLMSARQFAEAGADEIHHLGFLMRNFFFGQPSQPGRPSAVRFALEMTISDPPVKDFIALLAARHVTIDPTLANAEQVFAHKPGRPPPGYETLAPRLPPNLRRELLDENAPSPEREAGAAFTAMLTFVKTLYDAGVTIVPGTDSDTLAGFRLQRELELYVRAGIAPAEVLRMATYGSARNMHAEGDLGTVASGKYADFLLIDGDPTKNIGDIRRVHRVVKDGRVFDPRALHAALSIRPEAEARR